MQRIQRTIGYLVLVLLLFLLNSCIVHFSKQEKFNPCNEYLKNGICLHHLHKKYNQGISELNKNESFNSITCFNTVSKNKFTNEKLKNQSKYMLALAYGKNNRFNDANKTIQLADQNNHVFYNYNNGVIQLHVNEFEKAEKEFQLQLNSNSRKNYASYYGEAYAQARLNKNSEAISNYNKSNKIKSQPETYIGIATILLTQNQPKASYKILKRGHLKHRKHKRIIRIKEMISYLPELVETKHKKHKQSTDLTFANYYFMKGNYETALLHYHKIKTTNQKEDANIFAGIGNVLLAHGDFQKAKLSFQKALEKDSICNSALQGMGLIAYKNYDDHIASYYFKKVMDNFPVFTISYDTRVAMGNLFINANQLNKAKKHFYKALDLKKKNDVALSGFAYCISRQKGFIYSNSLIDSAFRYLKLALKISPNNQNYIFRMGILSYLKDEYLTSEKYFKKAVELVLNEPDLHNALAFTLSKLGKFNEAKSEINKAIQMIPDAPNYYINAGVIYTNYLNKLSEDGFTDSLDNVLIEINNFYDKAILLGADSIICKINYAYAYVMSRNYHHALKMYNALKTKDSIINAARLNNIGVVHSLLNENDDALQIYSKSKVQDNLQLYKDAYNLNIKKTINQQTNGRPNKKDKFTSIVFYTINFNLENRSLSNSFAYPINEIYNLPPDLILESKRLNDHCKSKLKTSYSFSVTKRFKGVSKKSFTFCSKKD